MKTIKNVMLAVLLSVCSISVNANYLAEPVIYNQQLDERIINEVTETFTGLGNYDTPLVVVRIAIKNDGTVAVTETNNTNSQTCKAITKKLESLCFADAVNDIGGKEYTYAFRIKTEL